MKQIPQNIVPKANNYSDKLGDFVESFSIDLTKEYGSFMPSKMNLVYSSDDSTDLELAVGFANFSDSFYLVTDDFVYDVANDLNGVWSKASTSGTEPTDTVESLSDMKPFNSALYVSSQTSVYKWSGSTWTQPITTQLTNAHPHLMEVLGTGNGASRLYITDEYSKVHSINTSDVISATGAFTMDLGLSSEWTITMLKAGSDSLWIGCLNTDTGTGYMFQWDGATENTPTQSIPLTSGVMAGVVLDGVPYYVDTRGRLMKYVGTGFVEVDRINIKREFSMAETNSGTNIRFIHPNGMVVTDYGSILIFIENQTSLSTSFEDSTPSGIYEYTTQTGLYHKYALTNGDRGNIRVNRVGAIFFNRATTPSASNNGTVICSAEYYDGSTLKYGLFVNDSNQEGQGYGYFVTPKLFGSSVEDVWKTVSPVHDILTDASDKIVVKYRTREKNSITAECAWLNETTFTTTTDITTFEVGDEVTIARGDGAGQTMHITAIEQSSTVYTITVDANPLSATGTFFGKFQNFKKLTTIDNSDSKQYHTRTITTDNVSPWAQFKVEMFLTKKRLHRLFIDNKAHVQ